MSIIRRIKKMFRRVFSRKPRAVPPPPAAALLHARDFSLERAEAASALGRDPSVLEDDPESMFDTHCNVHCAHTVCIFERENPVDAWFAPVCICGEMEREATREMVKEWLKNVI